MISGGRAIRRALFSIVLGAAALCGLPGCGYSLQNAKTNSLREIGIHRIYIAPVKNFSYKPGVENIFYNELIQVLLAGRRVKVVDHPENSDAILETSVDQATYHASAATGSGSIFPTTLNVISMNIATEYQADVTCSFHLKRQKSGVGEETVWESGFTRSKRFAGNNQKAEYGTTSGLINESEFDRTLGEVAHTMMQDVHEAMVARF